MKRPLLWAGILAVTIAAAWNSFFGARWESRLCQSEELLTGGTEGDGAVTLTGKAAECSAVQAGTRVSMYQIVLVREDGSEKALPENQRVIFTIEEKGEAEEKTGAVPEGVEPGDVLLVSGQAQAFERAGNPGQFDSRSYYFGKNTVCALREPRILEQKRGKAGIRTLLYRIRSALRNSGLKVLGEEDARTAAAVALGEKAWMDTEVKALYQEGGIAHIASVSGLHVSLLGMGLYRLLRHCYLGIGGSAALSGVAMLLYAVLTGQSVSAVRAVVMFLVWLGAQVTGRKYDLVSAAFAALIFLLAARPSSLTDSSLLLSFGAVFSIAVLVPELREGLLGGERGKRERGLPEPLRALSGLASSLVFSFGLWLGMLPLTLWFFYQTPVWGILVNLLVVPLMPFVMGFTLLGSAAGLFSPGLGTFLAVPVHYILWFFDWICNLELCLPKAIWVAGRPSALALILYYGVLAAAILAQRGMGWRALDLQEPGGRGHPEGKPQRRRGAGREPGGGRGTGEIGRSALRRGSVALWAACIFLCPAMMRSRDPEEAEILCLDVGQGDSSLLRLPTGEVYLIDGGSSSEGKVWRYRISQTLKYYGESRIDGIFLSHADSDHTNGVEEYLGEYRLTPWGENAHGITLEALYLPPTADGEDFARIRARAEQNGISVRRMAAGDSLASVEGKNWQFLCLAPLADSLTGDKNQDSMVLLFTYGDFRMLFTGDLEGEAERELAASGQSLSADVLKVGHHGSKNASFEGFLEEVCPAAAVISCGRENRYGHPAPEAVSRLTGAGSRILATDEEGAVAIKTDGITYSLPKP